MRRTFARICLKSMVSLLVGAGLATSAVTANAISLPTSGTTIWTSVDHLEQGAVVDIRAGQTLVLDTREKGEFFLDADFRNKGVVQVIGSGATEWNSTFHLTSGGNFLNGGTLELKQATTYLLPYLDNISGIIQIDAQSKLLTFELIGGQVHGAELSSQIGYSGISDVTLAGRLTVVQTQTAGNLNITGQVHMVGLQSIKTTTLHGTGQTVLRDVIGAQDTGGPGVGIPPRLTIAAGHRVDAAGQFTDVSLVNQGQIEVAAQQILKIDSAVLQQGPDASLVVNGILQAPNVQLTGGHIDLAGRLKGDVLVEGGTLHLREGSIVQGNITVQSGRVKIHSPVDGIVEFDESPFLGDIELAETAEFEVEITSDRNIVQMAFLEELTLGGKLIVTFANGAQPLSSEIVLIFDSIHGFQGAFNSLEVRGAGSAPWSFAHQGEGLVVLTSAVPEPETWSLMLCGLGMVGWRLRRRVTLQTTH